ncbi:MOSC domain-containing protein [Oceanibacterium hippocampi]|uniref:MOSC domain protein n=1 Tax=Oceanibacterium hippocampi TaxID=745714 RepID=A0A1Y5R613_9PROT|nr:MOSC domain-containing protein [Oceanibacterium hippocampi]SLN09913.1 MOSC domain protein [Oceanibacterium hippocampi]
MNKIEDLYRYPVKGLSAEALEQVSVAPGDGIPGDRRYAIAHGTTEFDPEAPEPLPKTRFLMLMRNERLAALKTRLDPESGELVIERDGRPVSRGVLSTPLGRSLVEQFFAAYLGEEARGAPKIVSAEGHRFDDMGEPVVSLINLRTVGDIQRVAKTTVDPLRFRGNIHFSGEAPWCEFDWIDREVRIGDATLRIFARITRCAATEVNPTTAARDLQLLRALRGGYGHVDCGVYAHVIAAGRISRGDTIQPLT